MNNMQEFGKNIWENLICLNPTHTISEIAANNVSISEQVALADLLNQAHKNNICMSIDEVTTAYKNDLYPIPTDEQREGYYAGSDISYFLSGLDDVILIENIIGHRMDGKKILDFGCASGRVIRHWETIRHNMKIFGVDINKRHINYIIKNLSNNLTVCPITSNPHLPFTDNSFDLIYTFSVFTHLDIFDIFWIAELSRILKFKGKLFLTFHDIELLRDIDQSYGWANSVLKHPDYPKVKAAFDQGEVSVNSYEAFNFRWRTDKSYTANTFVNTEYVKRCWGQFFSDITFPAQKDWYQSVVVFTK